MKTKFTILFLLILNFSCFAQLNPSKIVLKNGDTITGIIGKLKNKTFKYKKFAKSKPKEIDFSDIDFVQIQHSRNTLKTYKFFQTQDNDKLIAVEELAIGRKVQLYGVIYNINSNGVGGISINQTKIEYYIKKKNETKLTLLGAYAPLTNNLKEKTLDYFSDCKS